MCGQIHLLSLGQEIWVKARSAAESHLLWSCQDDRPRPVEAQVKLVVWIGLYGNYLSAEAF